MYLCAIVCEERGSRQRRQRVSRQSLQNELLERDFTRWTREKTDKNAKPVGHN